MAESISLAELHRRYDLEMKQCGGPHTKEASFASRRACEIGWLLCDAGYGSPPRVPQDTRENLVAADAAGVTKIDLTRGRTLDAIFGRLDASGGVLTDEEWERIRQADCDALDCEDDGEE